MILISVTIRPLSIGLLQTLVRAWYCWVWGFLPRPRIIFLRKEIVIAVGAALMVIGWFLVSPGGKWSPRAVYIKSALGLVGCCMIAVGMVTVVQARN